MAFVIYLCVLLAATCAAYCSDPDDVGEPLILTGYINSKNFDKAKRLAAVKNKEMNDIAPSYSGYLTVKENTNGNTFFWYVPAAIDPHNAPLILWLQGGPGESSLLGLFYENGPFCLNPDQSLSPREYSWHKNHHLLYFDNPVGTGYSFTDDDGYATNEVEVGADLYEAMRQFLTLFTDLQSHEFYIAGESYAGKYVSAMGYTILQNNQCPHEQFKINLVGLAISSGLVDPVNQLNYGAYLYQLGLIDKHGLRTYVKYEAKIIDLIHKKEFAKAFSVSIEESPFFTLTGLTGDFNYINPDSGSTNLTAIVEFVQLPSTRRAIHVGNNPFHDDPSAVVGNLVNDILDSVADLLSVLLSHCKVFIFNGQLDVIEAYPLTEKYLQHLKFSGAEEYETAMRTIWTVDDDVAGYKKTAGNLTEVLVRNAGHRVTADQPKWVLDLILQLTHPAVDNLKD